jgi:hypothetical protein
MTQQGTDGLDPGTPETRETFREWRRRPANTNLTNGRLLASRLVWTFCLALAAFVGYRQIRLDNQITRERVDAALVREVEDCIQTNDLLQLAKEVAEGDVKQDQASLDSDRASWLAIDDLFPDGIPEPARTTVFAGLQSRQDALIVQSELVDTVYQPSPCGSVVGEETTD